MLSFTQEALLDAAEHGDVDKMKLLLKRGYAVNVRDKVRSSYLNTYCIVLNFPIL